MRLKACIRCKKLYSPDGEWEIDDPCTCENHDPIKKNAAYIQPDIEPYKSMITGEMITSRSKHRQHLKDHNCIEAGNEQKYFMNMDKAYQVLENDIKRKEKH